MTEQNPPSSSTTLAVELQRSERGSSVRDPIGSVSRAASQLSLLSVSTSEALACKSSSLKDPDLEAPPRKPLKALIFQIGLPITTFTMSPSSSAVTVSTKYLGKPPSESIQTEAETRLERLLTERLKTKPMSQHAVRTVTARDAGIIRCESIKSTKQPATIPSGTEARETRKELDQTQGEFFCVTQLTKEVKPPPPEVSCTVTIATIAYLYIYSKSTWSICPFCIMWITM